MERSIAPVAENAAATVVAKIAATHGRSNGRSSRRNITNTGHQQEDLIDTLVRKPKSIARAQDRTAELTSLTGRAKKPQPVVEILPKKDEMNSKDSLADWLSRRAAMRAQTAQKIEAVASKPEPLEAPTSPAPVEVTPVNTVAEPVIETLPTPAPVVEQPVVKTEKLICPQTSKLPDVQIDASLWESLISDKPATTPAPAVTVQQSEPEPAKVPVPEVQLQLIRGAAYSSDELMVPAGMHDHSYLAKLQEFNKPFTGLVVSISVCQGDGKALDQNLMHYAGAFIGGLLGDKDFGCRTKEDDFLLICNGLQGAEAQRRLSFISERLWDFQLRGLGTFSILFSWGGVDVRNEPLSEAVCYATERMTQTRRTRKTVSMDSLTSVPQRRKAV